MQPIRTRALELVQRTRLGGLQQLERGVGRARAMLRLRRRERTLGPALRVDVQRRGALEERRRRCVAAARLRTPRGALELGGDLGVRPGGRLRAMPGAAIGVDPRIGRLRQRPVHAPAFLGRPGAVDRRTDQRMPEQHARARLEQARLARGRRSRRARARVARPRAGPAPNPRTAPPPRRAAAAACRAAALRDGAGSCLRCVLTTESHRATRSRRRARRACDRAAARAAPAGCRASRRRSDRAPARPAVRRSPCRGASARRAARRPSIVSSGSPASSCSAPESRAAKTSATDSASRRRATNASASAEARSSHCTSSTTQTNGRSSAASESRLRTDRPTRRRSGGVPALRPNAVRSALCCGGGIRSRHCEQRATQLVQAGERQFGLGLDTRRARDTAS